MEWVLGISAIVTASALLAWRFDRPSETTYGAAQWCRVWAANKAKLFRRAGIRVGDWTGRLSVFYDGAHAITFGSTGSGKGVNAILPNLLSLKNVFLVDPGGENTAIAAKFYRQENIPFHCINIFSMFTDAPWSLPEHGFNPLDLLDAQSASFAADALVFAEMLTPRTGGEQGSSSYFKDAATSVKRAMLVHIKTSEPSERQNIATLYSYVNGSAEIWAALLSAMKDNETCGGLVQQEAHKLERIEAQAGEEFSAIMSTVQQDLSFLADPLVREHLARSDVDFTLLKKQAGVISVVLPLQYVESHAAITRLAMACAILVIQRAPLPQEKITFLIDETAALGKILRFPNWLATLRKYRVSIWSIWQNIGQVVDLYGKNWQGVIANCGLVQILGINDPETAQYTEKFIGKTTVKSISINPKGEQTLSQTARALVSTEELLRLKDNEQIVLTGNLWPLKLKKTPYWKRPALKGRYYPNPYYAAKTTQAGLLDQLARWWGRLYLALVWWMTPHPLAACVMSAPLLWLIARGLL